MDKIFVVDDEKNIRELIEKYLAKEGYEVMLFSNAEGLAITEEKEKPALIVMDIMMPGIDGLEICKEIRKKSDVPIIFVSAKDEEFDRIVGLEIGGDDYLTKPFSPRELVVRIKKILKRSEYGQEKIFREKEERLCIKDISIDLEKRAVYQEDKEIKMTMKEYELFSFLVKNKNISFTREQLIEKIWGYDYIGDIRVIDDLIKRIRKKMKNSQLQITTVWGFGYRVDV